MTAQSFKIGVVLDPHFYFFTNLREHAFEQIKRFRAMGSHTPGHPEFHETLGVEATTGPLGQGVSNAVGYAVSQKMAAANYNNAGFTSTVASYTLARTGLQSEQDFLHYLARVIADVEARPAHLTQSAEESSLDAWLEKYALYNQPQNSISYYTKGQVLGVLLDIVIRDRTDNQHSLDDLLRVLNTDFAKEGRFYRDSLDIRLEAEKLTGGSLEDFFDKYVASATPLPYSDLLNRAGLELHSRESVRATLGFLPQREASAPWTVISVDANSSAQKAALQVGDEIIRWNGGDVPRRPERWAGQQKPGDVLHLRIRHDGEEKSVDLTLGEVRERFFQIAEIPTPNDRAHRIRDGLYHGTTDPITANR